MILLNNFFSKVVIERVVFSPKKKAVENPQTETENEKAKKKKKGSEEPKEQSSKNKGSSKTCAVM